MFHTSQLSDLGLPAIPGGAVPLPPARRRCRRGGPARAVPLRRRFRFRAAAAVGRSRLSIPSVCVSVPAAAPSVPGPVLGGAMNRPKAAAVRRPSAVPKPSGESRGAGRALSLTVPRCPSLSLSLPSQRTRRPETSSLWAPRGRAARARPP